MKDEEVEEEVDSLRIKSQVVVEKSEKSEKVVMLILGVDAVKKWHRLVCGREADLFIDSHFLVLTNIIIT